MTPDVDIGPLAQKSFEHLDIDGDGNVTMSEYDMLIIVADADSKYGKSVSANITTEYVMFNW